MSRALGNAESLARLQRVVVACRRCPRLVAHRERVAREKVRRHRDEVYWGRPLPSFGDLAARLLVVGLAPAAHGGNRTGRMFTGDDSGHWLSRALYANGFANQPMSSHREDGFRLKGAYITASLRCVPPENRPTVQELANCRPYFLLELRLLLEVRVVVALGRIAFDAYLKARGALGHPPVTPRPRFGHNREWRLPEGVTLIASYHPSRQNTQTGKLTRPMFAAVFRKARRVLRTTSRVLKSTPLAQADQKGPDARRRFERRLCPTRLTAGARKGTLAPLATSERRSRGEVRP